MIVATLDDLLLCHSGLQDAGHPRGLRRLAARPQRKTKHEEAFYHGSLPSTAGNAKADQCVFTPGFGAPMMF